MARKSDQGRMVPMIDCRGGGMADAQVSKTCESNLMRVRLSPAAHTKNRI